MECHIYRARDKVMLLCQARSAIRAAKVAMTSSTAAPLSEVSDKIESLTIIIKSLLSTQDGSCQSSDHQPSSRQHRASPSEGVHAIPLVPISLVCIGDAIIVDGLVCP